MTEPLTIQSIGNLPLLGVQDAVTTMNMLIYGHSGMGKTVLVGSACEVEELGKILIIDVEGGTLSLKYAFPNATNLQIVRVKSFRQIEEVYVALRDKKIDFDTVVLDSITECQKFGMYEIMRRALEQDSERDPDLPGIGEWGKNTEQIRRLVRAFRDLPQNCIFTALEKTETDKRGRRTTLPSLSTKLAGEVAAFIDIVVRLYIKEVEGEEKRLLLCRPTEEFVAKDRTRRLPPVIEAPTMSIIYDLIMTDDETPTNNPGNGDPT